MDGQEQRERAKWLRRVLVVALGVAASLLLPRPGQAAECPPGDRADWRFEPTARRADRIEWIVLTPEQLYSQCRSWRESVPVAACAWTWPDPVYGGNYAVIYATEPRERLPEWLVDHEECHTQGWYHGKLVDPTVPGWSPAYTR